MLREVAPHPQLNKINPSAQVHDAKIRDIRSIQAWSKHTKIKSLVRVVCGKDGLVLSLARSSAVHCSSLEHARVERRNVQNADEHATWAPVVL